MSGPRSDIFAGICRLRTPDLSPRPHALLRLSQPASSKVRWETFRYDSNPEHVFMLGEYGIRDLQSDVTPIFRVS